MSIGNRLKEERERLGMTQDQFSNACGVRRRAQSTYENGERCPDSKYLEAASNIGVDVGYVLTGRQRRQDDSQHMDFHDFGWAAAEVLGISEQDLLVATNKLNAKMNAYAIDADALSNQDGGVDAYMDIFYSEIRKVVKELIGSAISSSSELDSTLLSNVLDGIEAENAKLTNQLSASKKAGIAVMLYRAFRASGNVDEAMVKDAVKLVAG